jgi:hypothetical protein
MVALYGFGLLTVVIALYLLTLQRALNRCSPTNRTMSPGLVWLQLIPLFGLYWHFRNVLAIGESFENESRSRGVAAHRPHQSLGIAMGICLIVGYGITWSAAVVDQVPNGMPGYMFDLAQFRGLAALLPLAGFLCAALYWMRVARTSREIAGFTPQRVLNGSVALSGPGDTVPPVLCRSCGRHSPAGHYCPYCGSERTV